MDALKSENLVSEESANALRIDVVKARTNHVQQFFLGTTIFQPPDYTPQNRDQKLNKIYAECVRRLTASNQTLLQASERAWITYRDADISALAASGNDQKWRNLAIVELTEVRSAQLTAIVQSLDQIPTASPAAKELPPPPVQNTAPYPDDVKALAQFQNDAKAVLNAILAKKDDPFFKKADALRNLPELPDEIANRISKLDATCVGLSDKPYADKLLEPALNECATIELLAFWSKFTRQVKEGNVTDADLAIQTAISRKPKDISPAYLPFWQTVGSWHDIFVLDEAHYYDHVDKGNSFAAVGKTSAAIKEYQAAYDIFTNSTTSEKIKKLREQSLGL